MENSFSYSNISKFEINFMINEKTIFLNVKKEKEKNILSNKCFIDKLPKNQIFHINSMIFNEEKRIEELYNKYDCIYNDINNVLYLIMNEKYNYANFTKEKLLNLLEFSISLGIDKICLLVSKKNHNYLKIIQDMMIVGFNLENNKFKITIDGNEYKTLKMSIKDICQEIKEISLI